MIRSFKHKDLEKLYLYGDQSKINPAHTARLLRILDRLDASINPKDMNMPCYRLRELKGKEKGTWSVWVSGSWRVTFQFDGNDAVQVDYRDYH